METIRLSELKTLDDALLLLEEVTLQVRDGKIDIREAQTFFQGIKAFTETYQVKLKHDPRSEAQKEFARGVARKAVEAIDLDKAKQILLSRDWQPMETEMGIIDAERVIAVEDKQAKRLFTAADKLERKTPRPPKQK
jgi:hypothetical protein